MRFHLEKCIMVPQKLATTGSRGLGSEPPEPIKSSFGQTSANGPSFNYGPRASKIWLFLKKWQTWPLWDHNTFLISSDQKPILGSLIRAVSGFLFAVASSNLSVPLWSTIKRPPPAAGYLRSERKWPVEGIYQGWKVDIWLWKFGKTPRIWLYISEGKLM